MPFELAVSWDHSRDQELFERAAKEYLESLAKEVRAFLAEKNIEDVEIEGELRMKCGEPVLRVIVHRLACDGLTRTNIFSAVNRASTYVRLMMRDKIITPSLRWGDVSIETEFKDPEQRTAHPSVGARGHLRLVVSQFG